MNVLYRILLGLLATAGSIVSMPAAAQTWPSKPVQLIVPQGAGGSTDALARLLAPLLGERLGQTVVIDNRAGAGGVLGVSTLAKAPADGYTLLFGSSTTVAANAFLYASFPIDPLKDLVPLALAADAPFVIVVPGSSPSKSLRELVATAKASPGKLNYGFGTSSGLLCMELLKSAAGIDIAKVPYKASAQALTDLIGGQLDVVCEPLSSSAPNAKAGRLRILAGTGTQRSSLAPELETVGEAGVKGMAYSAWVGFFAPAGVPRDVSAKLGRELMAILRDPAVQDKMRAISWEPRPGDAEALAELLRAEIKAVAATVKAAGIKAE
ncbi:Bug family tripartite tricarboxylate transporter substrate binding protein [Piscinibacter koreensis]|uniref:Tripartite tricarboxylate transporter substrate binding protein n=1 Tax=Piscinibacter koreensis TaxID=2742824 RepID=A0A7Y6NQF2_9BURK|nr:tripartite tricarboxylate transporter substrate binding protein [Schlegelella koreensis]NUZ07450.1 tripartite tricarboxylate transporter substrate binding protein [Schlegelella koreensis]